MRPVSLFGLVLLLSLLRQGFCTAAEPLELNASRFAPPPQRTAVDQITLVFTGDTKLCGRTLDQMRRRGESWPYALVRDTLRGADFAFANCETALTDWPTHTTGKSAAAVRDGRAFVFRSEPRLAARVLADCGFDLLQLANNHAMDYGAEGLAETLATLDAAGLAHVGAGHDYASARAARIADTHGLRIGWLAYSLVVPPQSAAGRASPGINTLGRDYAAMLERDIAALRPQCDLVCVGFHWGVESTSVPDAQQRRIGRAAVDAGADLVIGTHPHSLQGVEFYRDGVIAYSLGNFIFTGASQRLAGGILRAVVEPPNTDSGRARISAVEFLPCWILDGRPTPSTDAKLRRQVAEVMRATGTELTDASEPGWVRLAPRP